MEIHYLKFNLLSHQWIVFASTLLFPVLTKANEEFDINAINTGVENQVTDVSTLDYFSYPQGQLPGTYQLDIFINNHKIDNDKIEIFYDKNTTKLIPKITKKQLIKWGIKSSVSTSFESLSLDEDIHPIENVIVGANIYYDFFLNQLHLSIPQVGINSVFRGYVDPVEWDDGINTLFTNYSLRYSQYWGKTNKSQNIFLGLHSGINFGAWRARNQSHYSYGGNNANLNSLQTFIERDIRTLNSHFTMGEITTDNGVMEVFPYLGMQLMSEESMLAQSQRGFAPIIKGIAQTNAHITVTQNNQLIYQTDVPAGEFVINDLYSMANSGDLNISIEEMSGTTRNYTQPFSALPIMQRAGTLKYSIDMGKYQGEQGVRFPYFAKLIGTYGLPNHLAHYGHPSVLGGVLISQDYQSYILGGGLNLGRLGAVSTDFTYSSSEFINKVKIAGRVYRVQYAKYLQNSGTGINLSLLHYASANYVNFVDSNSRFREGRGRKQRLQAVMTQSVGYTGYLSLNGFQQSYWGHDGVDNSITANFSSQYQGMNLSVSYSYTQQYDQQDNDGILAFNLNMPFSWKKQHYWGNASYQTSRHGDPSSVLSINGIAFDDDQLHYDLSQRYNHNNQQVGYGLRTHYLSSKGEYGLGVDYSSDHRSINGTVSGGLLLHSGGLTASRNFYDSAVLVNAPNIPNLKITNVPSLYTNTHGYALIPMASRYERNNVSIDASTLAGNYDIPINTKTVVPTQGAIVLADFEVKRGGRILLKLKTKGNQVALGSQVNALVSEQVVATGMVANDGEVYLSGVPEQSVIQAIWGVGTENQCQLSLTIDMENTNIQFIEGECK
ncbi:fimbria/pilus outer membrane usher protein [Providencia rustigianii]|uniref:Fimbrial usher protein n=9 Tax=Providencia rustigianii TaxID=158850 RepID=D1NZ76_9GAMM|nr:fimbria/pilus outer membrane usher protein [Providencia rustigianii]EFB73774.1 fimbrial usher protein [Providencia rustigianii DSM 4541]SUC26879.1 Outer membrane usher protein fimD precursor [Providencia rustigianii]